MNNREPKLPILKPTPPPQPFPFGALVHLRSCLHGEPGRVQGIKRGRVIVHWAAWSFTGRYRADRLVLADEVMEGKMSNNKRRTHDQRARAERARQRNETSLVERITRNEQIKKPTPEPSESKPDAPKKLNPYQRLLQKLDAASGRVQAAEEKGSGQR